MHMNQKCDIVNDFSIENFGYLVTLQIFRLRLSAVNYSVQTGYICICSIRLYITTLQNRRQDSSDIDTCNSSTDLCLQMIRLENNFQSRNCIIKGERNFAIKRICNACDY